MLNHKNLSLVNKIPHLLLWVYLLLITAGELLTTYASPGAGLMIDVLLVIGLSVHAAAGSDVSKRNVALALILAPLTRLLSLSLPLIKFPQTAWYPIVSLPLLASAWIIIRYLRIPRHALGLRLANPWLQMAIAGFGMSIGAFEYTILRPGLMIPKMTLSSFVVAALILTIFTGFTEELIFRGILQSLALRAMGGLGLVYVSLLFGVMHIGYRSLLDFLFVLVVGLIFALIAYWSGSILGVTLAHGLANITLFLIMPYAALHTSGWLSANINLIILAGVAVSMVGVMAGRATLNKTYQEESMGYR